MVRRLTGAVICRARRCAFRCLECYEGGALRALSLATRRDLRRAALLGWIIPLPATRSSTLIATATASVAAAWSPLAMVVSAFLTKVRADDTYGRLWTRRRSATRIRFSADLLLATIYHLVNLRNINSIERGGAIVRMRELSYQKTALRSSVSDIPR